MEFQIYWQGWYRLIPWISKYPADEHGPAELFFGWSIFQFRKALWRYDR